MKFTYHTLQTIVSHDMGNKILFREGTYLHGVGFLDAIFRTLFVFSHFSVHFRRAKFPFFPIIVFLLFFFVVLRFGFYVLRVVSLACVPSVRDATGG